MGIFWWPLTDQSVTKMRPSLVPGRNPYATGHRLRGADLEVDTCRATTTAARSGTRLPHATVVDGAFPRMHVCLTCGTTMHVCPTAEPVWSVVALRVISPRV